MPLSVESAQCSARSGHFTVLDLGRTPSGDMFGIRISKRRVLIFESFPKPRQGNLFRTLGSPQSCFKNGRTQGSPG